MAIKKYHISTNLLDFDALENAPSGTIGSSTVTHLLTLTLKPDTVYSVISNGQGSTGGSAGDNRSIYVNGTALDNVAFSGHPVTGTTTASGEMKIVFFSERTNAQQYISGDAQVWLVEGSDTTVPYEPYGNTWNSIPYHKYGTETDTITTLPKEIIGDRQSATANIIGNMVQTGTPSPSSIIMPDECGNKTANLFDKDRTTGITDNCYINQSGTVVSSNEYYLSYPIAVDTNSTYTWRFNKESSGGDIKPSHSAPTVGFYDNNDNLLSVATHTNYVRYFSFTIPSNCAYIRASVYKALKNEAVLNEGTTPIAYQPYGYKIPILSGGTTTNKYLGEVQSTRNIYKWVLTGSEEGWFYSSGFVYNQTIVPDYLRSTAQTVVCSHFKAIPNVTADGNVGDGECALYSVSGVQRLYFRDSTYTTSAADFKTYLQQQYAAGTPVTVWYVLATPQTTTLNEPIRKIGNYADSVSVSNLPTTGTAEQFDVDTTLKPSEVDLTYHGWHRKEPKERVNGSWV